MADKTYYPRNPLTQHFLRTGAILPDKPKTRKYRRATMLNTHTFRTKSRK